MNIPKKYKITKVVQNEDQPFHLTWVINNFCNNRCSYCPPDLHNGKRKLYDEENIKKFLNILISKHKKIHCSIAGGEPTFSPHFSSIVKIFNENNCTVGVTSNGARNLAFWEKNVRFLEYIVFSYHIESKHNEDFFEKVNFCKNLTNVTVRVMMLPSRWDECIEIYKIISRIRNVRYEPVKILDWNLFDKEYFNYTEYQNKWFNKNSYLENHPDKYISVNNNFVNNVDFHFENGEVFNSEEFDANYLINAKLTNFYNYECEIGLKSLFIYNDGKIYSGNCGVGGVIGNLNDVDNIKWPSKSVICNKKVCHCTTDVNINKKIIENIYNKDFNKILNKKIIK
jgi:MoaA/NifB/PqqE/SkfB family radical SAM enzyme